MRLFHRMTIALCLPLVLLLIAGTSWAEARFVTEGSKAKSMDACVAPTEIIRRNHMDYLKHDRDDTVRDGKRNQRYSLVECIDCHAAKSSSGEYHPVNAEDQFCGACHEYVAVEPACFGCHRTTPQKSSGQAGLPDSHGNWPSLANNRARSVHMLDQDAGR